LAKKTKKPGEHIHQLANERFYGALLRYFGVGGAVLGVVLLFSILGFSVIGAIFYTAGLTGAYYLYLDGKRLIKRSGDARRGAAAEGEVASLLLVLDKQRWQVEYNLKIKRWGDADVVLLSPKGNWYVIDVKSHGGTKVYEGGLLRQRYGRKTHDFREGDLIAKVKGQAKEVAKLKGASSVTSLLCFTRSDVDVPGNQADGTYIVSKIDLVDFLVRLDK
jgi:Nuclease-related domain